MDKRAAEMKRDLDGVPAYDKDNLAHVVSVLTHVCTAFTGVKGALEMLSEISLNKISPDGKLGGRGFVMPVKDVREKLANMLLDISNLRDTFTDELNNPNWGLSPEEKDQILQGQNKASDGAQEVLDGVDSDLGQLGGEPSEGDVPEEGDLGGELQESSPETQESPEELDDTFPDMGSMEEPEAPEQAPEAPQVKKASSSNNVFVGMRKEASPVARALASKVLEGLVKKASEGIK